MLNTNFNEENNSFGPIHEKLFNDDRLSWRAKGIMLFILDKYQEGQKIDIAEIIKFSKEKDQQDIEKELAKLSKYDYLTNFGGVQNAKTI